MKEPPSTSSAQTHGESQQESQLAWSAWNRDSTYNYSRRATLPDGRIRIEVRSPRLYSGYVLDSYTKLNQRYNMYPRWSIPDLDTPATPEPGTIRLSGTDINWGKTIEINEDLTIHICDNREYQFIRDEVVPLITLHYTPEYRLDSLRITTDRVDFAPIKDRMEDLIAKPYTETFPMFYAYMRELSDKYLTQDLMAFDDHNEKLLNDFESSRDEAKRLAFKIETDLIKTLPLSDQAESGEIVKKYRLRDRIECELLATQRDFLSDGRNFSVDQARKAYGGNTSNQSKVSDDRLINIFVGLHLHSLMFDSTSSSHETSMDISNINDEGAEVVMRNSTLDESFTNHVQEVERRRIGFKDSIKVGKSILSLDKKGDRIIILSRDYKNNWAASIPLDLSTRLEDIDAILFESESDFRKLNSLIPLTFEFIPQK